MPPDLRALSVRELADFYQSPLSNWVRSNMVISLDGHFDDSKQTSDALSSELDLRVLLLLRALSDVIVVGGRTARKENYTPKACRPEFREIARPQTRVAVITNSLEFEYSNILFHGETKPILLTTHAAIAQASPDHVDKLLERAEVIPTGEINGAWVIEELQKLGLLQVVCEGGPFVQNLLRSSGVLNEMDVTISPMLMGENTSGSAFGNSKTDMQLHSFAFGNDQIFTRYLL